MLSNKLAERNESSRSFEYENSTEMKNRQSDGFDEYCGEKNDKENIYKIINFDENYDIYNYMNKVINDSNEKDNGENNKKNNNGGDDDDGENINNHRNNNYNNNKNNKAVIKKVNNKNKKHKRKVRFKEIHGCPHDT